MTSARLTVYAKDGSGLIVRPKRLVIDEGSGQHQLVTMDMSDIGGLDAYLHGAATVDVSVGTATRRIHGYLDTVVPATHNNVGAGSAYVLGATSIARSNTPTAWSDASPFRVVSDIAKRNGLSLEMDSTQWDMPYFTQSDGSDWQTIVDVANRCGLMVHADNTTVRITGVRQVESRSLTARKAVYQTRSKTVRSFERIKTKTPLGYGNRVFYGVDSFGTAFSVSTDGSAVIDLNQGIQVDTLAAALTAARSADSLMVLQDRATLIGALSLGTKSGETVLVDGVHWYVSEVKHSIDAQRGDGESTFALCRTTRGPKTPTFFRRRKASPGSVFVFGKWRSKVDWRVEL